MPLPPLSCSSPRLFSPSPLVLPPFAPMSKRALCFFVDSPLRRLRAARYDIVYPCLSWREREPAYARVPRSCLAVFPIFTAITSARNFYSKREREVLALAYSFARSWSAVVNSRYEGREEAGMEKLRERGRRQRLVVTLTAKKFL